MKLMINAVTTPIVDAAVSAGRAWEPEFRTAVIAAAGSAVYGSVRSASFLESPL